MRGFPDFPYGRAPLAILLTALLASAALGYARLGDEQAKEPDLIFATFTKEHAAAYAPVIEAFERERGVTIQLQVVDQRALQGRLASAMQVGADVPDMVEIMGGTMGFFTNGPIEGVGFIDLNEKIAETGLRDRLVESRFALWSSRGHTFGLPHDVHPTMLAYRRDLVEELGIDVNELKTWDDFVRVGREVATKDLDGDGVPDRYMIDLQSGGSDNLRTLLVQRGGGLFDEAGDIIIDSREAADTIEWYVKVAYGPDRIAFPAGWGQTLAKCMLDGLVLFYICPDWRTMQFQMDVPGLSGKMDLMPLPAWEEGSRRTSTWGGTGLAFTRQCRDFDLAWDLAMELYYKAEDLGPRFAATNILPPLKAAWEAPEFHAPSTFYSGTSLGRVYSELASDVPEEPSSPYERLAMRKLSEAFISSATYFEENGENGLRAFIERMLKAKADEARREMERDQFLKEPQAKGGEL